MFFPLHHCQIYIHSDLFNLPDSTQPNWYQAIFLLTLYGLILRQHCLYKYGSQISQIINKYSFPFQVKLVHVYNTFLIGTLS